MPFDLDAKTVTARVTPQQLVGTGTPPEILADHAQHRVRAELHREPDGRPSCGLYLDGKENGKWVCVSHDAFPTPDHATTFQVRMNDLMTDLQPYYPAWLAYHGATPEPHGWVWLYSAARARELGLTAYEIAKRTGGEIDQATVQRYLAGRAGLGVAKWEHIARVLGLTISAAQ